MKYAGLSFVRKRHVMKNADGSVYRDCESISKAKKLSREIQGGGGKVSVDRTEDPQPPRYPSKRGDAADRFIAEATRRQQAERIAQEQERKRGPDTLTLNIQARRTGNVPKSRRRGTA